MPTPSFRQRLEGHPLGVILGVAVAAISATLTIVIPLMQITQDNRVSALEAELQGEVARVRAEAAVIHDQDAATIEQLGRSLSSIRRSLGPETEYIDVASVVVTPEEARGLPSEASYLPDERWYALDASRVPGWTYEVTTELAVQAELLGVGESQLRDRLRQGGISDERIAVLTKIPLHRWTFGEPRVITWDDPILGPSTLHVRTQVFAQRVGIDDYLELSAGSVPLGDKVKAAMATGIDRDPAGWTLQDQLRTSLTQSSTLFTRIESLQKRGPAAYSLTEQVIPHPTVDGEDLPEYYVAGELLIVAQAGDLYLLRTQVADDDHRAPDYAAVSSWFDLFRIVGG